MPTLHVKTNEQVMTKILTFLDSLSGKGEAMEVRTTKPMPTKRDTSIKR